MNIVQARAQDAAALTDIAMAAKRHWGYPEIWIEAWREALMVTPDYLVSHPTFVATVNDATLGFCALQMGTRDALLDHLWVLPSAMGKGVGRALFQHAELIARQAGAASLKIVGDPHAAGFYEKMGAQVYGQESAPVAGQERWLPLLQKALSREHQTRKN